MDTGSTFAIGHYNATTEKMHLLSDPDTGTAVRHIINYDTGVYKWATTGPAGDGRLLTIAWVDEGECAEDSPRGSAPRDCNGMRHRSVLSLPRELAWDPLVQQLVSRPVREVTRLHNATFELNRPHTLPTGTVTRLTDIPEGVGAPSNLVPVQASPLQ